MVKAWLNCPNCGHRYATHVPICPRCNAANPHPYSEVAGVRTRRKYGTGKKIAIGVGVGAASILSLMLVIGFWALSIDSAVTGSTASTMESSQLPDPSIDFTTTELISYGTSYSEKYDNYRNIHNRALICQELFPVPAGKLPSDVLSPQRRAQYEQSGMSSLNDPGFNNECGSLQSFVRMTCYGSNGPEVQARYELACKDSSSKKFMNSALGEPNTYIP